MRIGGRLIVLGEKYYCLGIYELWGLFILWDPFFSFLVLLASVAIPVESAIPQVRDSNGFKLSRRV